REGGCRGKPFYISLKHGLSIRLRSCNHEAHKNDNLRQILESCPDRFGRFCSNRNRICKWHCMSSRSSLDKCAKRRGRTALNMFQKERVPFLGHSRTATDQFIG